MPEAAHEIVLLLPLVAVAGLSVDVLVHLTLARILPGGAHVRIQFVSFGVGMVFTLTVLMMVLFGAAFSLADRIGYFFLNAIIYTCCGFGLFNVINANVSSLRVRMVKEYFSQDPQPLPDELMYSHYPASEILASRLARLEAGGQIYRHEDRYYARPGGVRLIGKFFGALRWLLLRK